uniref:Uncharacterized protein n=1 Tax=Branchiostoma floridae TaxID=7739 RepID=C3XQ81_BRAFL|eukprot:XP_002614093.1 hypothetical protein BRAFLDRAFT_118429 [Branchiostoma floridae]
MAEGIKTPDDVPTADTNDVSEVGLTQVTSNPRKQKDLDTYAFTNVLPNPMYETRSSSPSENDADRSVPVEDSKTVPETRYVQNTYEKLTNHGNSDKDGHTAKHIGCNEHDDGNHMPDTTEAADDTAPAIEIADDDIELITEQNICQNDMEASKPNIHPTTAQNIQDQNSLCSPKNDQNTIRDATCLEKALDQPNRGYTTNIRSCNSNNKLYAEKNTTNNDDHGTNVIPQNDIEVEIQEPVDVTDVNDDLEPYMPYAVAYVFPNPSYKSAYNSTENDADNVANGNNNPDIPGNRHVPCTDPSSMRDGLRRNPMYVPNVLQQAECQYTYRSIGVAVIVTVLLAAAIVSGTLIYFHNDVRDVQKGSLSNHRCCQQVVNTSGLIHSVRLTLHCGWTGENSTEWLVWIKTAAAST